MNALPSLILETTLWIIFLQPFMPFLKHPLSINIIVNLPQKINWYLNPKTLVFITAKPKRYQTLKI